MLPQVAPSLDRVDDHLEEPYAQRVTLNGKGNLDEPPANSPLPTEVKDNDGLPNLEYTNA